METAGVTKPFLFLGVRPEDAPADEEYAAFRRFTGLGEHGLHRIRLEREPLGEPDLDEWSGVILGGGPFNVTDPPEKKSPAQVRAEDDLRRLLTRIVAADFPFLGACYGVGTLGGHQGAVVDRQHPEPIGAVEIELTPEGRADPLFADVPGRFDAFVGHKEAISELPPHAVLLARSAGAPVQAFRIGRNVYATQFHPELDLAGVITRVDVYQHHGYFPPGEGEAVKAAAARADVVHAPMVLRAFTRRYARVAAPR